MEPAHRPPHPILPRRAQRSLLLIALTCLLLTIFGAIPLAPSQTAEAQGGLTAADLAVLDQVRQLTAAPDALRVRRTPDGGYFVDLNGSRRMVVLSRLAPDGRLLTSCVGSVEEAAAFLSGAAPVAAEAIEPDAAALRRAVEGSPALLRAALDAGQTMITVNAGAGFGDSTPAAPVGGNTGTTIGAQRLIAFQYAARIWAAYLQTTVPIVIDAGFSPLGCNILGSAGPKDFFADFVPSAGFPGPEHADTWYVPALANKRAGRDLNPAEGDISASFSSTLGTAGCNSDNSWYYGLDGQGPSGSVDLVSVLLHELGHGLGFFSLVQPNGQMFLDGRDDIWNYFLYDNSTGKLFKDMSVIERSRAITNTGALVWDGPAVKAAAHDFLYAQPILTVTAPPAVSGQYDLSGAAFGAPVGATPLGAPLAAAVDADEDGPTATFSSLDACSTLTNAAAVAGKIALLDRGGCSFVTKVKNAQQAGAVGAIIINNAPSGLPTLAGSDASVTIVAVGIAQSDGADLRAALAVDPVEGQIGRDATRLSGADSAGRVRLYAPSAVESGSSVSHFDITASPNLLMEPFINADISQGLDLTDELMRDIGWYADLNYNGTPDPDELDLAVTLAASPSRELTVGSSLTITLTVTSAGALGASAARLVDTFPAKLGAISWTASYSGGASGPAGGSGNINAALVMPSGSRATLVIAASVVGEALTIANTATVTSSGAEIDTLDANNQASLVLYLAAERAFLPLVAR